MQAVISVIVGHWFHLLISYTVLLVTSYFCLKSHVLVVNHCVSTFQQHLEYFPKWRASIFTNMQIVKLKKAKKYLVQSCVIGLTGKLCVEKWTGIGTARKARRHFSGLLNYAAATWRRRPRDFEKWNVRGKGKQKGIGRRKSY